jgi:hypothetical protein
MLNEELASALRASVGDGGWGYFPGKASRLEPTTWALRALGFEDQLADRVAPFLERSLTPSGLFSDEPGSSLNYVHNALVLLSLIDCPRLDKGGYRSAIITKLILTAGRRFPFSPTPAEPLDGMLQGWGWIDENFSWVEPTAWCLVALKRVSRIRSHPSITARIDQGEKVLVNRCCVDGGWNAGDVVSVGHNLKGHVPTTAVGLLALRDRPALSAVTRGVAFLERHANEERSGMGLALALMALRAHDRPVESVRIALEEEWRRTQFLGNLHAVALALCAVSGA